VEFNWTFVFQIINTLILYYAMKRLLFKPVTSFMESRQNSIAESLSEAETKEAAAEKLKLEYQSKLDGAQDEARDIIRQATKRADQRSSEIVQEAQGEAKKVMERAEAEIKREQKKTVNLLKNEMATLAIMAAGKMINKSLDGESHNQLIKEFIDEVGEEAWKN
jgi:F-type H+-transporting ATPase subunit b